MAKRCPTTCGLWCAQNLPLAPPPKRQAPLNISPSCPISSPPGSPKPEYLLSCVESCRVAVTLAGVALRIDNVEGLFNGPQFCMLFQLSTGQLIILLQLTQCSRSMTRGIPTNCCRKRVRSIALALLLILNDQDWTCRSSFASATIAPCTTDSFRPLRP